VKTILVPYHHADPLAVLAQAYHADDAAVVSKGPPGPMLTRLYDQVATFVAMSMEPAVVVSGDCTTSLATVAGLQRRGLRPGVIWIDAHADFHTAKTTRTGYLGGMALAMLTGEAGARLREEIGLAPVPQNACALVGVREIDPGEREAIEGSAIRRLSLAELGKARLPAGPWYVHVDVDVLDPEGLPPLRFPVPGGPSVDLLADALGALAGRGTIAAFGLGCTFTAQGLAQPDSLAKIRPLIGAAMGIAPTA
jgi:arginase